MDCVYARSCLRGFGEAVCDGEFVLSTMKLADELAA
jgi:hypothetical protein